MKNSHIVHIFAIFLFNVSMLFTQSSFAEYAIVVHPSNASTFTPKDVQRIFLGKKKTFPNGSEAIAIDGAANSGIRQEFNTDILKKTEKQLSAFWTGRIFNGKGSPPRVVESATEIKALVAKNPNLIGYIDKSEVDDSVKVVSF